MCIQRKIPEKMKPVKIKSIPKKGDLKMPANLRPINFMNPDDKLLQTFVYIYLLR